MIDNLEELFDANDEEFLKFDRIPEERRLSSRSDLHAFILLDRLIPGKVSDIVANAEHDEIFLDVDCTTLAEVATEEQIIDLIRCGVRFCEYDCLAMFV